MGPSRSPMHTEILTEVQYVVSKLMIYEPRAFFMLRDHAELQAEAPEFVVVG